MSKPKVAVLRPDDARIEEAVSYLQSLDISPIADPMLAICPTGQKPQQADYCIFTSKTGVELAADQGWQPCGATICAVGRQTATALQKYNYTVGILPSTFTSQGLVNELSGEVAGRTVEIARSAHGSDVLPRGLENHGADVHETHLYELSRPRTAGQSVTLAIEGELDGILFTSPKTVEHFVEIAREQDDAGSLQDSLQDILIGAIGDPTERTVEKFGISVDVKPDRIGFKHLADCVANKLTGRI